MRAIDADAFKEYITSACEDMKYLFNDGGAVAKLITESFCKDIDEQPTIHTEPHWIPVTERLPKSKEEDLEYPTVLICFENEEIMLGCFYESTKEWGTGEYFDKKCDPIAWMPLPEPYNPTVPPECEGDCGWCKTSVIEKCKEVTT